MSLGVLTGNLHAYVKVVKNISYWLYKFLNLPDTINPLTGKLCNWNFHPSSCLADAIHNFQVNENHSDLTKCTGQVNNFEMLLIYLMFYFNIFESCYLFC